MIPSPNTSPITEVSALSYVGPIIKSIGKWAAYSCLAITSGVMTIKHEDNPVAAIESFVDDTQSRLGKDFCPPAPTETVRSSIMQAVETAAQHPDLATAREKAREHGLSFSDPRPTFEALMETSNADDAAKVISEYTLANFGFKTSLDAPVGYFDQDQKFKNFRYSLGVFALYTSVLPRELVKNSKVEYLNLTTMEDHAGRYHPDRSRPGSGSAEIAISWIKSPYVFLHEVLGHAVHYVVCEGRPHADAGYTQFNPEDFRYYGKDFPSEYDKTVLSSEAAGENNLEDVGYSLQAFLVGSAGVPLVYEDRTPLWDKTAVMLDRIDSLAPGSAEYLMTARSLFTHLNIAVNDLRLREFFDYSTT